MKKGGDGEIVRYLLSQMQKGQTREKVWPDFF